MTWIYYPSFRFFLSLILGLLIYYSIFFYQNIFFASFLIALSLFLYYKGKAFIYLFIFILGLLIAHQSLKIPKNHFNNKLIHSQENVFIKAKVVDAHCLDKNITWLGKKKSYNIRVKYIKFLPQQQWIKVKGKTILRIKEPLPINLNYGDIIEAKGTFKEPYTSEIAHFDYKKYLKKKSIKYLFYSQHYKIVSNAKGIDKLQKKIFHLRNYYLNKISHKLSEDSKKFVASVIFSFKEFTPLKIKESFQLSGMIHILAISGIHISLLSLLIICFLSLFQVPLKKKKVFLIVFLLLYLTSIGFPVSAVRAFLMISIWCLAYIFLKNNNGLNCLFWTGLIILLLQPLSVLEIGFQYSFLIVFFLLISFEKFYQLLNLYEFKLKFIPLNKRPLTIITKTRNKLFIIIFITFIAFFASLGLNILYNQIVNPFSIIANLFSSFILMIIMLSSLLNYWSLDILTIIQEKSINSLLWISELIDEFFIFSNAPHLFFIISFYVCLTLVLLKHKNNFFSIIALILCTSFLFLPKEKNNTPSIHYFNIDKKHYSLIIKGIHNNYFLINYEKESYIIKSFVKKEKIKTLFAYNSIPIKIKGLTVEPFSFDNLIFTIKKSKEQINLKIQMDKDYFLLVQCKNNQKKNFIHSFYKNAKNFYEQKNFLSNKPYDYYKKLNFFISKEL